MLLTKNRFKSVLIAVIIVSLFFSLTNYTNSSQNIDNLAYVMAIGIDVGKISKYTISVQISTIDPADSQKSDSSKESSKKEEPSKESSSSSNYIINTVDCDSIDSAISIINSYIDKKINLSYCKVLVLSEEVAKQGVSAIVNSLINKVEIRPDCNIVVSRVSLNEFEDSSSIPEIGNTLSKYYESISSTTIGDGYNQVEKLSDFYYKLHDFFYEPSASLGSIVNSQESNSSTNPDSGSKQEASNVKNDSENFLIENNGLAVFKDDKLVGYLTNVESICHLLTTNKLNNSTISINSPFSEDEKVDLYLSTLKNTKSKVRIINGSPYIVVDYDVSLRILAFNSNTAIYSSDMISEIEEAAKKYLTEQIYNYLNKTSKELNADVAGFGKDAAINFITLNDWNNYNWLANYKNSTFKVNVKMSIKPGYVLMEE